KQIASSDELLTTAILGLSKSSSFTPSAFHCARRTASRGVPGSKLLLRTFAIARNLSQNVASGWRPKCSFRLKPEATKPSLEATKPSLVEQPRRLHGGGRGRFGSGRPGQRPALESLVLVLRSHRSYAVLRRQRHRSIPGAGGVVAVHQARVRRERFC